MKDAQKEEFKHFSMDLEFLLRQSDDWRKILSGIVGKPGDFVKNAEAEEKAADQLFGFYTKLISFRIFFMRSSTLSNGVYPCATW